MKDFIKRLTSRKFLLTFFGAGTLATNEQWGEFCALILGYIATEGGADIVAKLKSGVSVAHQYINDESHNIEVDTTKVVTGKDTPLFNEEVKED